MVIDPILRPFIKNAKTLLDEGKTSKKDFAKALNIIYAKMYEFNGTTLEEFYSDIEKI